MNQADTLSFHAASRPPAARLQQLYAALPYPVLLFDVHGQLEFANHAAQCCPDAQPALQQLAAGATLATVTLPGLSADSFAQVLATAAPQSMELSLPQADGRPGHYQITLTPLCDASGKVDGVLQTRHDVTRQRQEAQRLQLLQGHLLEMAHRDALTNLANRRYLELKLERLAADSASSLCALLFIDLDRFKPINDAHGHDTGDAVLSAIAARLKQALRGTDLLARIGGDEFAILLEGVTESGARAVAGKIIQALDEPFAELSPPNRLGLSVGICLFKSGATMPAEVLAEADQAMYRAKRRGGGQFELQQL
ncbi:GGDEF domain-containing protein [Vogesella sp. AC12]|uniref:GGDEF domain-containing protein n=1 Tax=Vogesella sp. AC12 TaxID=2950550 RepID=UPI00210EEA6C|nr:GGDEF domain-containing protein [Vogesella sp. AC12]MCQ4145343.1 GGDEF domain-containing protein [Vogesella sp. AC12]